MDKNIETINYKGDLHGYQEYYNINDMLVYRGNCKNDDDIGYQEYHNVKESEYYIRWNYGKIN